MRIRLVLVPEPTTWILAKFADRLKTHLAALGVATDCAAEPDPSADVNHWIYYRYFEPQKRTKLDTLMITHVDGVTRLRELKERLAVATAGICMSSMTRAELIQHGLDGRKLFSILPAHDDVFQPRRIRIVLTTRLYENDRKSESKLVYVAKHMRLNSFHFDIIGAGWQEVIPTLEAAGATVRYHAGGDMVADYRVNREWVPEADYYLYMGEDEGSMGFLDALAAGVKTIVTPQGFHRDLEKGIDYPFWSAADLVTILQEIDSTRERRRDLIKHLTWDRYSAAHLRLWQDLLAGQVPSAAWPESDATARRPLRSRLRFRFERPLKSWRKVFK